MIFLEKAIFFYFFLQTFQLSYFNFRNKQIFIWKNYKHCIEDFEGIKQNEKTNR